MKLKAFKNYDWTLIPYPTYSIHDRSDVADVVYITIPDKWCIDTGYIDNCTGETVYDLLSPEGDSLQDVLSDEKGPYLQSRLPDGHLGRKYRLKVEMAPEEDQYYGKAMLPYEEIRYIREYEEDGWCYNETKIIIR